MGCESAVDLIVGIEWLHFCECAQYHRGKHEVAMGL